MSASSLTGLLVLVFICVGCGTKTEVAYLPAPNVNEQAEQPANNKEPLHEPTSDNMPTPDAPTTIEVPEASLSISWVSPLTDVFSEGDNVSIFVHTEEEGDVKLVSFFSNGKKIADDSSKPFGIIWHATRGDHDLTVVAYDKRNQVSNTLIKTLRVNKVVRDNALPQVSFLYPSALERYTPNQMVTLQAEAEDPDGAVALVTFYLNGKPYEHVSQPPYLVSWQSTLGEHQWSIKAIDNWGYSGPVQSQALQVEAVGHAEKSMPPRVDIITPHPADMLTNQEPIMISALATSVAGTITNMKLFVDGELLVAGSDDTLSTLWTSTPGTHQLQVEATDNKGQVTRSMMTISVEDNLNVSDAIAQVVFDDPALKHCLEETAHKQHWQSLDQVIELDCSNRQITHLGGLSTLPNLSRFNASNNLLQSADLSSLPALKEGDLRHNLIRNATIPLVLQDKVQMEANLLTSETQTLHKVALILLKNKSQAARFDKHELINRTVDTIDPLIRWLSYNHEGIAQVETFGWFDLNPADFQKAINTLQWENTPAIISSALDLTPYEYVVVLWDDIDGYQLSTGKTTPYPIDIQINQATFTEKSVIHLFLKEDSLQGHCFYKEANYTVPERCYSNPRGNTLTEFDINFLHEFIDSKGINQGNQAYFCDDVLRGICHTEQANFFDILAPNPFFSINLNAYAKHNLGWLDDARILEINENGVVNVTLHTLAAQSGLSAIKISLKDYTNFDLWLEYRAPSLFDYGLYHTAFTPVQQGVLVYRDHQILDATPDSLAMEGIAPANVALQNGLSLPALGVDIQIDEVNTEAQWIKLTIVKTTPKPEPTTPIIVEEAKGCSLQASCKLKIGGQMTSPIYQAKLVDIGYGDQSHKRWSYKLIGLPKGLTYYDTGIERQVRNDENRYTSTPHTQITFSADNQVKAGDYKFVFRLMHPDYPELYQDIPQWITLDHADE